MEREPLDENPRAPAADPVDPGGEPPAPDGRAGDSDLPPGPRRDAGRNVASKALRGLFWVASTGLGSRIVSLVSSLLLLRYVTPGDYGEAQNTYIVVWAADLLAQLGIPAYIAGRDDLAKRHLDHAKLVFHALGLVAMLGCLVIARPLGPHLGAPNMHLYMPAFVAATLLQRVATIPDRMLVRELRFRAASVVRAVGEVVYAGTSLGLAMLGTRLDFKLGGVAVVFGGGFAIAWGGVARGLFRVAAMAWLVRLREWFAWVRLEKETTRHLTDFGVPITMAVLGGIGSRRFDNLVIGNLYGPSQTGIYNFAYNLADVPSGVVGEALGDVLAPSFARTEPADRPREVRRWVGFSALLCFPLGVGLSAVAPSLRWLLKPEWHSIVPMIVLLGSLSLTRPIINTLYSYMQLLGRTRLLMVLEWVKAIGIVVTIAALGRALRALMAPGVEEVYGPLLACVAVGIVHVGSALSYQLAAARLGGFPARWVILPIFPPLLACLPLVAAVLAVRFAVGDPEDKGMQIARLCLEIVAGGVAYVVAAFVVARKIAIDFVDLLKTSLRKRREGG